MITLSVSFILSLWFDLDAAWLFIWVGLLGHIIGLILLGLANWRAKRLSPLNLLPLAVGLLGGLIPFALSFVARESDWTLTIMGYGLGLGWMLMGLLILTAGRAENKLAV